MSLKASMLPRHHHNYHQKLNFNNYFQILKITNGLNNIFQSTKYQKPINFSHSWLFPQAFRIFSNSTFIFISLLLKFIKFLRKSFEFSQIK